MKKLEDLKKRNVIGTYSDNGNIQLLSSDEKFPMQRIVLTTVYGNNKTVRRDALYQEEFTNFINLLITCRDNEIDMVKLEKVIQHGDLKTIMEDID